MDVNLRQSYREFPEACSTLAELCRATGREALAEIKPSESRRYGKPAGRKQVVP